MNVIAAIFFGVLAAACLIAAVGCFVGMWSIRRRAKREGGLNTLGPLR